MAIPRNWPMTRCSMRMRSSDPLSCRAKAVRKGSTGISPDNPPGFWQWSEASGPPSLGDGPQGVLEKGGQMADHPGLQRHDLNRNPSKSHSDPAVPLPKSADVEQWWLEPSPAMALSGLGSHAIRWHLRVLAVITRSSPCDRSCQPQTLGQVRGPQTRTCGTQNENIDPPLGAIW